MRYTFRVIVVTTTFLFCDAAKILVIFPLGAHSHFTLGFRLAKELADRGHQVTFMSPFPQKNPIRNLKEISLATTLQDIDEKKDKLFDLGSKSYITHLVWLADLGGSVMKNVLQSSQAQELLQSNETFDLVLLESFLNEAMMIFQYKFKCPSIVLAPGPPNFLINHLVANPSQPAYVPNVAITFGSQLTLWKRLKNLYYDILGELFLHHVMIPRQNAILQRTVPGAPDLRTILYNVSFLFTASHVSLNKPYPHQQNVIEIGGYHVPPPKALPPDLKEFLDNSKEGVIVFSMGSNLKSSGFPGEMQNAILKVFSKLRQKVLWKFETDLPEKPENVKILSWIPQQDVLAHPNVVLFITHAGLLGKTEAVYYGVPLLGMPVFWDQEKNIGDAVQAGFGLSVPFHSFTEEDFEWALNQLLNNPMYRENANRLSKIMKDQPIKPMDKAIFWIEYTIRHKGAPHYKSPALNLKWYQILMLDVIFVICICICAIILVIYWMLKSFSNSKHVVKANKVE